MNPAMSTSRPRSAMKLQGSRPAIDWGDAAPILTDLAGEVVERMVCEFTT